MPCAEIEYQRKSLLLCLKFNHQLHTQIHTYADIIIYEVRQNCIRPRKLQHIYYTSLSSVQSRKEREREERNNFFFFCCVRGTFSRNPSIDEYLNQIQQSLP